jgi:hypothetical protein
MNVGNRHDTRNISWSTEEGKCYSKYSHTKGICSCLEMDDVEIRYGTYMCTPFSSASINTQHVLEGEIVTLVKQSFVQAAVTSREGLV